MSLLILLAFFGTLYVVIPSVLVWIAWRVFRRVILAIAG
jgi:hypothetical protein